jgi:hypothetical protein
MGRRFRAKTDIPLVREKSDVGTVRTTNLVDGRPGDAWGLSYLLLALLALGALWTLRRLFRKPQSFRSDLTKQMLEMPVRRFRRKHRRK